MTWTYQYDDESDETTIYHNDEKIGTFDGRITSWMSGLPMGDAKEIIKQAVDDPMIVDLLYGFSERDE